MGRDRGTVHPTPYPPFASETCPTIFPKNWFCAIMVSEVHKFVFSIYRIFFLKIFFDFLTPLTLWEINFMTSWQSFTPKPNYAASFLIFFVLLEDPATSTTQNFHEHFSNTNDHFRWRSRVKKTKKNEFLPTITQPETLSHLPRNIQPTIAEHEK